MRVKDYQIEQLHYLPLSLVRNLDVQTKEEEITLQAVLNERMKTAPVINMPQLTIEEKKELDSPKLTVEREKEIEAKLEERRAKYRAVVSGETNPSIEKLEIQEEVEVPEVKIETPVETPVEVQAVKKFCNFCNSKGVRHKKECTRLTQ